MKLAIIKKQKIANTLIDIFDLKSREADFYFTDEELAHLLKEHLIGISTQGLPNRTRSKLVKTEVCKALGYNVPKSFKKTQPRFLGQNFDTYVQKSLNLQIWNEEVSDDRRYVIIEVSDDDIITNVKVINGKILKLLDTTGTLTQKFQARLKKLEGMPDVFGSDTDRVQKLLATNQSIKLSGSSGESPKVGGLLSIEEIAKRLTKLIGTEFDDEGGDQDRNRGAFLQKLVSQTLGYSDYNENGQSPDILAQLLETKLQTSPTIDLGRYLPTEKTKFLDIGDTTIRYCDIRYAVFEAKIVKKKVKILNFAVGAGLDFFSRFEQFQGKVVNKKIQIPLKKDFFKG